MSGGYPNPYFRPPFPGDFNWGQPPLPPYPRPSSSFPPPPPPPPQNPFFFHPHRPSNFPLPKPNPNHAPPQSCKKTNQPKPSKQAKQSKPPLERSPQPPSGSGFQNDHDDEVYRKINGAVDTVRDDLVAARRSVSSWKVLQSALLRANVDAETCLGLRVEQLPSLHRLMITQGRINAFIHCYVNVRTIISLYDLEVAICRNERIQDFEELGLGPLLRHPLVLRYFSVDSEATEVCRITTEEIVSLLSLYLAMLKEEHSVEEFLSFVAKKRSVAGKEKLGIRISNFRAHVSAMRKSNASECVALWKSLQEIKPKDSRKSRMCKPNFSALKERLDAQFQSISQQSESCSVVQKNTEGDIPVSSRSEDEGINDCLHDDRGTDLGAGDHFYSIKSPRSSEIVGKCSDLSKEEERSLLMLKNLSPSQKHKESKESVKMKRKYENLSRPISVPAKFCKRRKVEQLGLDTESDCETMMVSDMPKLALEINNPVRMFVTEWKEVCKKQPVAEVLWAMLCSYDTNFMRITKFMKLFAKYPLLGLLNVAVLSIKYGMWDNVYDMSQTLGTHDLLNNLSSIQKASPVISKWATERGQTSRCWKKDYQIGQSSPKDRKFLNKIKIRKSLGFAEGIICHLCNQEGHRKRYCPQQSYLEHQKSLQLAQDSAKPETSIQKFSDQPLQSMGRIPVTHNHGNAISGEVYEELSTLVDVKEIIKKVATYFENDRGMSFKGGSLRENIFIYFRKLWKCELWLTKEFSVMEFRSLGYGDFMSFLEKYAHLLPQDMFQLFIDDSSEKCPVQIRMLPDYLVALVSQALNSLWEDHKITALNISSLIRKQFPSVSFQTIESGSVEDFKNIVGNHKDVTSSKCVLFSMTLGGTSYSLESLENCRQNAVFDNSLVRVNQPVASKEAIAVLLRAPMMSDLNSWSHWDLLYAPSLGPLVPWLLNDVNSGELLCLATTDGKVIRLDHSATVHSFSKAALEGSSFLTALEFLSLVSLVGGEKHVPVSLLKFHVQHAFEVISRTCLDGIVSYDMKSSLCEGKVYCGQKMVLDSGTVKFSNLHQDVKQMTTAESVISHFFLDCLGYLPTEFRSFAADVLLSGMRSVFKQAASTILDECNQIEQRLMLHEVGLSLGILEWISDYHVFSSLDTTELFISKDCGHNRSVIRSHSEYIQNVSDFDASAQMDSDFEDGVRQTVEQFPISVDVKWTIDEDAATTSAPLGLPKSYDLPADHDDRLNLTPTGTTLHPADPDIVVNPRVLRSSVGSKMDHPRYGLSSGRDAMLTGRLGEAVAYKYLIAKAGESVVRWVNERTETGLPYDIVLGAGKDRLEYIEVKATQNQRKDWFHISMREWEFAVEKGEAFSIMHILLLGNNAARVSFYKNPLRLCNLGKLELRLMMPKQEKELFLVS